VPPISGDAWPVTIMSNQDQGGSAEALVFNLIGGIKAAFDREPDAPAVPDNERIRLAEALFAVHDFIANFPGLGSRYANHFAELAEVLKEWGAGANPRLMQRTGGKPLLSSLESRAIANIILAVEAVVCSRVSLSDHHRSIDDHATASADVLNKFKMLKNWVDAHGRQTSQATKKIENWLRDFSRKADPRGAATNILAKDLISVGREHILSLRGNRDALHDFARASARRAIRNAVDLGVG
jgi:hypothetical protein